MEKPSLLFTGASGFLGLNIKPKLEEDYYIETIGLCNKDTYYLNLAQNVPKLLRNYEIVLHAAGIAHFIPKTEQEKQLFFDINLQGTKNLCYGLEKSLVPKALIYISSVAVYGIDSGEDITEEAPLKGRTPYAMSKILAESFLQEWCSYHKVILGIIRPSLIAGTNPPGNLGAMIKGINSGKYYRIGNGSARKSILMAEDIARIIPKLIEVGGIYNVCSNHHPSFEELDELIAKQLNKKAASSIPYWVAKCLAFAGNILGNKSPINSDKLVKLTKSLTFSNEKAKLNLGWEPLDVLKKFKII